MHPFRAAIEARDIDAAVGLLAENVEFRSPIVFRPYQGRDNVAELIRGVAHVFEDFRYVREMVGGRDHALVFTTAWATGKSRVVTSSTAMRTARSPNSSSWCVR